MLDCICPILYSPKHLHWKTDHGICSPPRTSKWLAHVHSKVLHDTLVTMKKMLDWKLWQCGNDGWLQLWRVWTGVVQGCWNWYWIPWWYNVGSNIKQGIKKRMNSPDLTWYLQKGGSKRRCKLYKFSQEKWLHDSGNGSNGWNKMGSRGKI